MMFTPRPGHRCFRLDILRWIAGAIVCLLGPVAPSHAQTNPPPFSPTALKQLSLEELLEQDVTIVSRTPERLNESASAVQVITGEDIRRSGATSIPEALRLAPNLNVAQVSSHEWAIDARGFNNILANKLLVMIDGRSVYTPLFAGVFWDVQHTLLADVERIEVVSGPGAALWGANAVNGVINIVTKNARATQGALIEGGGGTLLRDFGSIRYGGSVGSNFFYRVYGTHADREPTEFPDGTDATNALHMTRGGFRADWFANDQNTLTFQGDAYSGSVEAAGPGHIALDGQNILGRWVHTISDQSDLAVQIYFDRTWRRNLRDYAEDLRTYDLDVQHRFGVGERQHITWGAGYRLMQDDVGNGAVIAFEPERRDIQLFSGFLQDEIELVPDRWKLTLGTKLEHNDFSGFEYEPSARLSWRIDDRQLLWSAISRAVRTPSRVDADVQIPGTPPFLLQGDDGFDSEEVVAFELGYRIRPHRRLSLSVASYFNLYDNIRSLEPIGTNSFLIQNKNKAESWGVELSGTYQMTEWLRFRGGYTYLNRRVTRAEGGLDLDRGRAEGNDPEHQALLQAMLNLPYQFELDFVGRYVAELPDPHVPDYFAFDVRLGWNLLENMEISIVGQNLLDRRHPEFGSPGSRQEIPRSLYGKVTWRF